MLILGAGDFGRACARAYSTFGARVLVGDRREQALEQIMTETDSEGVFTYRVDVQSSGDCVRIVEKAVDVLGGIDVLMHAVGVNRRERVDHTTDDTWQEILNTNLTSAFWLARASLDTLEKGVGPKIVMFSSVSATLAHPKHAAYAASKGGLNQLIKVLAIETAPRGIHVNGISPGYVDTNLTNAYLRTPGVREDLEARVPMGRLGMVEDIVGPAMFLSSPRSDFVTGHCIVVDGGRSLD